MDIKELENIMISHSVVLRAIPRKVRSIYEKQHINKYPGGTVKYLEEFKREMLVVEKVPKNAGKFIFEHQKNTACTVRFSGKKYFDSIEQAIENLLKNQ